MARHYTKKEKVVAVVTAELSSNVAAELMTGVPESSIRRWRDDPDLAKYVDNAREDIAEGAQLMAHVALERIAAKMDTFEGKDLITLFGVMVDKAQLLTGGATARMESRDISGSITDAEVREAVREAQALLAGGAAGTPEAATDAPEG
jgi:hypothetical protein